MARATRALLTEGFIGSAVLGFIFGGLLFVTADQTEIVSNAFLVLGLSENGAHLGVKQCVIPGMALGILLHLCSRLLNRVRPS